MDHARWLVILDAQAGKAICQALVDVSGPGDSVELKYAKGKNDTSPPKFHASNVAMAAARKLHENLAEQLLAASRRMSKQLSL